MRWGRSSASSGGARTEGYDDPPTHVSKEQKEKAKTAAIALWAVFLSLGSASTLWDAFAKMPSGLQEDQKAATLEEYEEMPADTLAGRVSFWRR